MAAPKGNQFWKLRSKHGRDKLFASPDLLWEAACEYFEWCISHPLTKKEAIKSGDMAGSIISIPVDRPFTWEGLCSYLGCSTEYFRHFEKNNKDSKDFMPIITHISETIYRQKFENAVIGNFNAMLIARDLGLKEKSDITSDSKPMPYINLVPYTPAESK